MSHYSGLQLLPPDPILGLTATFHEDPRTDKVNLGVGAYRDADGQPYVLPSVREAERRLLERGDNKEYLPIHGNQAYCDALLKLILGADSPLISDPRCFAAQTVAGSGALRVAGELLNRLDKPIYVSNPTWANHNKVFAAAGLEVHSYPYYDRATHTFDFEGMLNALKTMPANAAVLLQPCCHNPTGLDPSKEQWEQILNVVAERGLLPFFDSAYQGLGLGVEEDAYAIRYAVDLGLEFLLCYSCSKNFGLYGERIGMVAVATGKADDTAATASQIKGVIRELWSSPPRHGAGTVEIILTEKALAAQWKREIDAMRARITSIRQQLVDKLEGNTLDHLLQRQGLFALTGLNDTQVDRLREEFGIYMPKGGRVNIAGIGDTQLDTVVHAFQQVLA